MLLSALLLPILASHALAGCIYYKRDADALPNPHVTEKPHGDIQDLIKRQDHDEDDDSRELIGDLKTGITTPIGKTIANIILRKESGESQVKTKPPKDPSTCVPGTCCIWHQVSAELTKIFRGKNGRCNDLARAAVRLGFHDAATWSKRLAESGQDFGGADGSLVLFNEVTRLDNRGLEAIVKKMAAIQKKYKVGMADLIQYGSIHATVTCPLGPRVRAFIGRKDATQASPEGLLPDVHADPASLVALFQDKTVVPHDLVALLGAHSTSRQFFVDKTRQRQPQDSTPAIWDVKFYGETLQPSPPRNVFRFPSDIALSTFNATKDEWQEFVNDQGHWNEDYATSYIRLSMLGVNNINNLTECTETLPSARPVFAGKDEAGAIE